MEVIPEPELTAERIGERYRRLRARLDEAAASGGHDPGRLRVVAVTKTWPVDVCRAALDAGLRILGENRIQEAEPKIAAVPHAEWHLVGRLQSNKARRAVRLFPTIHSIDSVALLDRVDRVAAEEDVRPRLLLEVNLSGEEAKAGFGPGWLEDQARAGSELARAILGLRSAELAGLMTIAPFGAGEDGARATFRRLRHLRERLSDATGLPLRELSMGMTGDATAAAEEGATLVRIGTALFGPRAG